MGIRRTEHRVAGRDRHDPEIWHRAGGRDLAVGWWDGRLWNAGGASASEVIVLCWTEVGTGSWDWLGRMGWDGRRIDRRLETGEAGELVTVN
jgi:hypothetical protein